MDEDDVRVRPQRGKSRPRTKDRPDHLQATPATVVAVDRGRYTCLVQGDAGERRVTAMKARELGRKGIVVGDRVALVGDVTAETDSLARVVRVEPRKSLLRRSADDTDPVERAIVANADQLGIVASLADPEPQPRLIDRCLVAAYAGGLRPLLILTKSDLASPDALLENYAAMDADFVVTSPESGVAALRKRLVDQTTVLVGSSGVGKSTLVNALVPEALRATGSVNEVTGHGRHTSTSVVALALPDSAGWVIDTPGIRSFGLAHVTPSEVLAAFPELVPGTEECPRSCTHDEPECGLDDWVAGGHADPRRLSSFRRLLHALGGDDPRQVEQVEHRP